MIIEKGVYNDGSRVGECLISKNRRQGVFHLHNDWGSSYEVWHCKGSGYHNGRHWKINQYSGQL